ncbi:MAG: hypothetical protein OXG15_00590 [Gammaproteobacteria bacterium]|nr:hypothetical protein [Gammaproteobacteria bacterium]
MTDRIKIKSIAPSFAQTETEAPPQKKRSFPWPIVLVVLIVVGAFVAFKYVPTQITYEGGETNTASNTSNRSNATNESNVDEVLPYRDIELQRAQESAKSVLAEFAELQDQVEAEQLGLKQNRITYDEIINAANQADASFARREYELAINQYRDATTRLREYVYAQESAFEDAFETGYNALVNRDLNLARESLNRAQEIKPNDQSMSHVMVRLEKLPKVNSLIREAERAKIREEFEQAELLLSQAREVDPETQEIDERIRELQQIQRDADYMLVLTKAHAALADNDLELAKSQFESALRMRPGEPAATTGLNEVVNRLGNTTIGQWKEDAERFERDGDLRSAMQAYAEVLKIDGNLQFALEGYERTQTTIRIFSSMDRILADPDMLSSNEEFEAAQLTLKDAREHETADLSYLAKVNRLEDLIRVASKPLPIVLVSDNEMEVRLATVGDLGPFDRKELKLRPGRYLLTGSGNGCRDVRKTIVVAEGMDPIAIVCNEPI